MKTNLFLIVSVAILFPGITVAQQKYICKNGFIQLYSNTPLEEIKAVNHQTAGIIDFSTNEIVVSVLMKSFKFEKALMEEHFNENYVESDKYPKATFKGQLLKTDNLDISKNGEYPISAEGNLTIHGVTKPYTVKGIIAINNKEFEISSKFKVKPTDHNIEIPSLVREKIAEEIEVTIKMKFIEAK